MRGYPALRTDEIEFSGFRPEFDSGRNLRHCESTMTTTPTPVRSSQIRLAAAPGTIISVVISILPL
jgi:hypothetical protein